MAFAGAFVLNFLALCVLLTALGFSIFLHQNVVLVWTREGCAILSKYSLVDLERYFGRDIWNQMFATGGFLVGSLAVIAFNLQERYLKRLARRRALQGEGQMPFLIRPLTRSSKADTAPFSLKTTSLLSLMAISVISCVAAVAALGMSLRPFTTGSPLSQIRTRDLHRFHSIPYPVTAIRVSSTDMTTILYHSALLRTIQANDPHPWASQRRLTSDYLIDDTDSIGRGRYSDLPTRGIGANPAKLESTNPYKHFATGFTVESLWTDAIGTNITATCHNVTDEWDWSHREMDWVADTDRLHVFEVRANDGRHPLGAVTVVIRDPEEFGMRTWLQTWPSQRGEPQPEMLRQFFVVPRIVPKIQKPAFGREVGRFMIEVTVVECNYAGHDVRQIVRLVDSKSPIEFDGEPEALDPLSRDDMYPAAAAISRVSGRNGGPDGGDGGPLINGIVDGMQVQDHYNKRRINLVHLLEDILTEVAQGYFSVLRSEVEPWGGPWPDDGSWGELKGVALRVGGSGWPWIGVIAGLAILPLLALARLTLAGFVSISMESQSEQRGGLRLGGRGLVNGSRAALIRPIPPPKDDDTPPPYSDGEENDTVPGIRI